MKFAVCLLVFFALAHAKPQYQEITGPSEPYEFHYEVNNPPTNTVFGQNENGDTSGAKVGSYHVLLPDGRTMTVDYRADAQGFVPRITFGGGRFQG